MTPDWYQCWTAVVLVLWALSTPKDRNALRIVLIASLASECIVDFITRDIHGAWKLVVPGAVEVLTILALMEWAPGRTGYLNSGALCIAWFAHILCYVDTWLKTDIVYSRYETIIQIVAVAQIAACYDTMLHVARRIREGMDYFGRACMRGVPVASGRSGVLLPRRSPNDQTGH